MFTWDQDFSWEFEFRSETHIVTPSFGSSPGLSMPAAVAKQPIQGEVYFEITYKGGGYTFAGLVTGEQKQFIGNVDVGADWSPFKPLLCTNCSLGGDREQVEGFFVDMNLRHMARFVRKANGKYEKTVIIDNLPDDVFPAITMKRNTTREAKIVSFDELPSHALLIKQSLGNKQ
eukprot:TRINITY_DN20353_c0_g1_i1.p1 TRINITY_DN20353_c0_g1~~TRINITY_DN20353_c0_g1_i1.p1  ORF type:complete len:174 (+),score=23.75 TRINITY_DN20353_c0_g1_i1:386-907(+)